MRFRGFTYMCLACAAMGGVSVCERCRDVIFKISAADDLPTRANYYDELILSASNVSALTSGSSMQILRPGGINVERQSGTSMEMQDQDSKRRVTYLDSTGFTCRRSAAEL